MDFWKVSEANPKYDGPPLERRTGLKNCAHFSQDFLFSGVDSYASNISVVLVCKYSQKTRETSTNKNKASSP